jgi:hypothetical protein
MQGIFEFRRKITACVRSRGTSLKPSTKALELIKLGVEIQWSVAPVQGQDPALATPLSGDLAKYSTRLVFDV